jgi:hypothetical protein
VLPPCEHAVTCEMGLNSYGVHLPSVGSGNLNALLPPASNMDIEYSSWVWMEMSVLSSNMAPTCVGG